MNCKPGDLAIVVRSYAGNEGKIVRCVRLLSEAQLWEGPGIDSLISPDWEVDLPLRNCGGGMQSSIPDCLLRPIRDPGDDAVDETLLRLPSPRQEVTA